MRPPLEEREENGLRRCWRGPGRRGNLLRGAGGPPTRPAGAGKRGTYPPARGSPASSGMKHQTASSQRRRRDAPASPQTSRRGRCWRNPGPRSSGPPPLPSAPEGPGPPLLSRAMHSGVGRHAGPLQSLTVQAGVVGEAHAGPHVAPDVLHSALHLALGLGRSAGRRRKGRRPPFQGHGRRLAAEIRCARSETWGARHGRLTWPKGSREL